MSLKILSVATVVSQKAADTAGKFGIAGGVTAEVGKVAGWFGDNVTVWQVISAVGVLWMIVDKAIRLWWDYQKIKREREAS